MASVVETPGTVGEVRRWVGVWLMLSMLYLLSMAYLPYTLHYVAKALPILWLAYVCHKKLVGNVRVIMVLALLFSAGGDVLLALTFPASFPAGLSSFLCAQILYCVLFYQRRGLWRERAGFVAGIVVFYLAMLFLLIPKTGELMLPVSVYMTVICLMGLLASVHRGSVWVMLGAFSFMVSDAVIAINKFWVPFDSARLVIMNTYYVAQMLIVLGVIQTYSQLLVKEDEE